MNNWKKLLTPFEKSYSCEKKDLKPQQNKSNLLIHLSTPLKITFKDNKLKESTKKLKDFSSYLRQNPQKTHFLNGNFQHMQKEYENLKRALKRKLFNKTTNTSRPSIKCTERISENNINIYDQNLNHTIENVKNGKLNKKIENKILLMTKTLPKNNILEEKYNNKLRTLKKREETKENQEKSTVFKRCKFPTSTEDELLDLLNKSCNTG